MEFTLKSGRHVYANRGIFGLAEEEDGDFDVTEGYDSNILSWPPLEDASPSSLTADDMREITDMMIDRWTRFRVSLPAS